MAARAYANEMLMRLGRSLDENLSYIFFVKLSRRFLSVLKKSFLVELISFTCYVIKLFC